MNKLDMIFNGLHCFSARQFSSAASRLSMNLLVKNEADIIADNIKVHSHFGVDCFVVMDNGSTDGTREIVEKLSKDYEIHIIDRPVKDYQQSSWKSEMAFVARNLLKADWVIANDADEFWLPADGNLKTELGKWGSIVLCPRYNMLLDSRFNGADYRYYESVLQVNFPILLSDANLVDDENLSIMLGKIHGKVIANSHGLLRVKGGNHRAWHMWSAINKKTTANISIQHYPIRSKQHFIDHIENRALLLNKGVRKMGDHYRRWVKLYSESKLDEELSRLVLSDEDIRVLVKFGVVRRNDRPYQILSSILNPAQ